VKVVDANVLLYAVNEDSPHHAEARGWLDSSLAGTETIGFAWVVLLAFLRLSTRPRLFPRPLGLDEAGDVIEAWLAQPPAVVPHPTTRHLALLRGLLEATGSAANLVNDAHVAALALEHDAVVVSYDADYARFEGVPWEKPAATAL
jgi:toxin-antitoxin system PIN domain toxin